jgi:pyruvate ferredoxin oxidoreductase delta subunit
MREDEIKYEYEKGVPAFPASGSSKKKDMKSWRVNKPSIDYSKCVRCKTCWLFCPESAIEWAQKPVIQYARCKGCLICYNECPAKAIRREEEWKS